MITVPIMQPASGTLATPATEVPGTNGVTAALDSVTVTSPECDTTKGGGSTLTVGTPPAYADTPHEQADRPRAINSTAKRYPKLHRRDSLDRREALLKGKEGSRQRRRWENDRLMDNPAFAPPLPSDWEVQPTYQAYTGRRRVPYWLAPLWDAAEFQRAVEAKLKGRRNSTRKRGGITGISPMEEAAANIPKEVRARLRYNRSGAAAGLLQDLEKDIRDFVKRWNEREVRMQQRGLSDAPIVDDSEDEEIVFIGRNGAMHDSPDQKEQDDTISREKLVYEAPENDKGAGFGRWLVHCLGTYYGLRTWSVTEEVVAEQARGRRQTFVGVDKRARGFMGRATESDKEFDLPRPLYTLCSKASE